MSKSLKNKIKIGFIADDIKNLSEFGFYHNTTFGLMIAAQEAGTKVLLTESKNLKIINNKVYANFDEVILKEELGDHLKVVDSYAYSLDSLNIIFARKDPPVDEDFLTYIQLLTLVSQPLIINNPKGILKANEKLYAFNFPDLIPPTLVTADKKEAINFLKKHREAVVKPLFNKGGEGVFYLNINDINVNPIIETSFKNGHTALIQKYLSEVREGDKRILLLNGEPLGGIRRTPKPGEFRAHISRGASFKPIVLSKRDLEICNKLKPYLLQDGLYFSAIDVIGDYLIEVNVTCPANLLETSKAINKPLAKEIVNWAVNTSTSV